MPWYMALLFLYIVSIVSIIAMAIVFHGDIVIIATYTIYVILICGAVTVFALNLVLTVQGHSALRELLSNVFLK